VDGRGCKVRSRKKEVVGFGSRLYMRGKGDFPVIKESFLRSLEMGRAGLRVFIGGQPTIGNQAASFITRYQFCGNHNSFASENTCGGCSKPDLYTISVREFI
jgi:hypothetical protein